jgi:hypothetical protein
MLPRLGRVARPSGGEGVHLIFADAATIRLSLRPALRSHGRSASTVSRSRGNSNCKVLWITTYLRDATQPAWSPVSTARLR